MGTVIVIHWLGTDGSYSIRLWTSSYTAAEAGEHERREHASQYPAF
jgi:hypothetical protein